MASVIWLTGLSGSGKTTIARSLSTSLQKLNLPSYILDGDVIRDGLCSDLGFNNKDRSENARRVAYMAKMLAENNVNCIVALITPFAKDRGLAKDIIHPYSCYEVYVNAPLNICQSRDPKGLYKAKTPLLTGLSSAYEVPINPDYILHTDKNTIEYCVNELLTKFYDLR
jgi:adenylylsulfate kinase